jgi:hypothetical protein
MRSRRDDEGRIERCSSGHESHILQSNLSRNAVDQKENQCGEIENSEGN